jgi:hypothetical protein
MLLFFVTAASAENKSLNSHPFEGYYVFPHAQGCANSDSKLEIYNELNRRAEFRLETYSCFPKDAPNLGYIAGEMDINYVSKVGIFVGNEDNEGCIVVFVFQRDSVTTASFGTCNVGQGADPNREFTRAKRK